MRVYMPVCVGTYTYVYMCIYGCLNLCKSALVCNDKRFFYV